MLCSISFTRGLQIASNMWFFKLFSVCTCTLIILAHEEPGFQVCDGTYTMFQKLANQEAKIASLEEKVEALEVALAGLFVFFLVLLKRFSKQ